MNATAHLSADDRGIVLDCPQCHRANRVPFVRLNQSGHCGSCKAALTLPSLPVEIDSVASFSALIRTASLPVLVDFWAPWCGPCQMVAPEVAKAAALAAGELLVVKVNTESQPGIAGSMGIRSIPTFAVFVAGREVERTSGAMSAAQLRDFALRAASKRRAGT
ncbi:MAG: thioredoxin domain-containing protein [Chthoniobacter sp.]|uniref:thioredoxin family protein n=1 Tax=Chthoniobacter sp. TaxID=2510640 RepID=UPI0032A3BE3E